MILKSLIVVVDDLGDLKKTLFKRKLPGFIQDPMEADSTFFQEEFYWLNNILLKFKLVVIHVGWSDKLAYIATTVIFEGVRVRNVDQGVVFAVNNHHWTLAVFD